MVNVTVRLQQQVASEFGFEDPDVGVRLMLSAEELYPDNAEGAWCVVQRMRDAVLDKLIP